MIKISFQLKNFERRAMRVKGLNKSKISYLINKVMAEFKCLHNSSYLCPQIKRLSLPSNRASTKARNFFSI